MILREQEKMNIDSRYNAQRIPIETQIQVHEKSTIELLG